MDEYIGASSHIISAIMQTLGLYFQGKILQDLRPLIETMGALFFVVGLVGAIISIAIFGDYKRAIYFALAPCLFFLMLNTTMPAKETEVRFGKTVVTDAEGKQKEILNDFGDDVVEGEMLEVSWFFVQVDNLVTAVVHKLIDIIVNTDNQDQIMAVGREKMLSRVLEMQSLSPGFLQLLVTGLVGQCNESSILASTQGKLGDDAYIAKAESTLVNLNETIVKYLKQDKVNAAVTSATAHLNPSPASMMYGDNNMAPISCMAVWKMTLAAATVEVEENIQALREEIEDIHGSKNPGQQNAWQKALNQAINGITERANDEGGIDSFSDKDPLADERSVKRLTSLLIKNSVKRSSHAAMVAQIFTENPTEREVTGISVGWRATVDNIAETAKLAYFSSAIHYVQGFLLMILCMIFPFFCLFLLIPSKATSFLIWVSLWIWVKSWDLGFAMIVVIKEFLWQFFTQNARVKLEAVENASSDDYRWSTLFNFITNEDEMATPFLYTVLSSLLTLAVPLFMGHLCLGASNLFRFLSMSANTTADKVGDLTEQAEARAYASPLELTLLEERRQVMEAAVLAARETDEFKSRLASGDAQAAEFLQMEAYKAQATYAASKRQRSLNRALISMDGRPTHRHTMNGSNKVYGAWATLQAEQYRSNPLGSGLAGKMGAPQTTLQSLSKHEKMANKFYSASDDGD